MSAKLGINASGGIERTGRIMIDDFRRDLQTYSDAELVNKYYISGSASAINDALHYSLRQSISDNFGIDYPQVFMVGSAKLGFSIKPSRRYLAFGEESDIDMVIICPSLYEEMWKDVFQFKKSGGLWIKYQDFINYHFKGWLRPDMLPLDASFPRAREWWEFFEGLQCSGVYGPYKIRGALYHSRFFFDSYHEKCFEQCREEMHV